MTKLLYILLLITLISAEPRRVPKIYNAVITSSENLEPSRAYPIVQPVFRPAAVAYQVQVPYVPQPQEIAAVPQFKQNPQPNSYPANIGLNGNQVKIEPNVGPNGVPNPSNDISPAGTYIQSQQAFGNLYQNQPSQAHGFVSIHTYPPNVSPNISPNLAQNIIQNLAQTIQHNGPNIPLTLQDNPHLLNRQQIPQQNVIQPNEQQNVQQSVPSQTDQTVQKSVPIEQQPSVPNQNYQSAQNPQTIPIQQNLPALQSVPNLQQTLQHSASIPQQSLPVLQQTPQNPPILQSAPSLQQSAPGFQSVVQQSVQQPVQPLQPSAQFQDHILNNSHRDRTIPDVPPPPLPTARRLPAERPPPPTQ